MGYQIQYGPQKYRRREQKQRKVPKWLVIAICAALLTGGLTAAGLDGYIRSWLLPGDPDVTGAALDQAVQNLRDGDPVGEVVTAFCEEIIAHAQIAQ